MQYVIYIQVYHICILEVPLPKSSSTSMNPKTHIYLLSGSYIPSINNKVWFDGFSFENLDQSRRKLMKTMKDKRFNDEEHENKKKGKFWNFKCSMPSK